MKKEYLEKLKKVLETDDLLGLDEVLELSVTGFLTENEINEIDEILNEATLYAEFKEAEYKEKALELIDLIV
ncbi:MAG: hypothetical protein PHN31_05820 [Candidatus Gracilibacteria bacterium]|nr:hypothetical protein [Candidatus Gracilibacteria bacterium]